MSCPSWMIPPGTGEVQRYRIERDYRLRERRSGGRMRFVSQPADVTDADRFPTINAAIEAGKADVARWDELQALWEGK